MLEDEHRTFTKDSFKPIRKYPVHLFQTIHVDLLKFHTPSKGKQFHSRSL